MDSYADLGSYIQGQFLKINDPNGEIESRDPGDLDRPSVPFAYSFEHVHEAVGAAVRGFVSWKRTSAAARHQAIVKYRTLLNERKAHLASCITLEVGKPLWESREEVEATLSAIDFFVTEAQVGEAETKISKDADGNRAVIRFFPRGVSAILSPANLPVYLSHVSLIPSLLHGNTAVLKSSKNAPITGQMIAEIIHDSGFPAGVVNVVHGDSEVARRLVSNPEVDTVFFTGSYETGAKIKKQVVSDYKKMLVLDLVGKNGLVVWEDCHYQMALAHSLLSAFLTTGQRYHSARQILVHEKIFDRFVSDFHALAKKARVGYGFTEGEQAPMLGPLVSEAAMENYLQYQGMAIREGCDEIMRGKTLEREKKGYYVSPSIHVVLKPDPKSVYQKNEIYGPNVAIYKVNDLDDVTEILNQTQYGMVSAIYTAGKENYLRLVEEVHVGLLHWNRPTTTWAHQVATGGIKKSGNARPMGKFAVRQCTYPMSSLEYDGKFDPITLPATFPKVEGSK